MDITLADLTYIEEENCLVTEASDIAGRHPAGRAMPRFISVLSPKTKRIVDFYFTRSILDGDADVIYWVYTTPDDDLSDLVLKIFND